MQTEMYALLKTELKEYTFGLFDCLSVTFFLHQKMFSKLIGNVSYIPINK